MKTWEEKVAMQKTIESEEQKDVTAKKGPYRSRGKNADRVFDGKN